MSSLAKKSYFVFATFLHSNKFDFSFDAFLCCYYRQFAVLSFELCNSWKTRRWYSCETFQPFQKSVQNILEPNGISTENQSLEMDLNVIILHSVYYLNLHLNISKLKVRCTPISVMKPKPSISRWLDSKLSHLISRPHCFHKFMNKVHTKYESSRAEIKSHSFYTENWCWPQSGASATKRAKIQEVAFSLFIIFSWNQNGNFLRVSPLRKEWFSLW